MKYIFLILISYNYSFAQDSNSKSQLVSSFVSTTPTSTLTFTSDKIFKSSTISIHTSPISPSVEIGDFKNSKKTNNILIDTIQSIDKSKKGRKNHVNTL